MGAMRGLQLPPSTIGFLIAFAYGLSSASMSFANKAVLSSYEYDYPVFLVTVQMVFTVIMLEALSCVNKISLTHYSMERGKSFFLPSLFYAVNAVLGLSALSGMNIPMYGMVKRCGPLVTLSLGTLMLGKGRPGVKVCVSVFMITMGCVVAGFGDLAFDLEAYLYGFSSVFSQSIYQVLVQRTADKTTATDTLLLNSYNTLPLLFVFSIVTGEMNQAIADFKFGNVGFIVVFVLVICMGAVLNYLLFLCITYNSALTTAITGTLKSILSTIIGMFTFGGLSINVFTVSGILLNLSGGILYALVKYQDGKNKAMQKSKSMANFTDKEKALVDSGSSNSINTNQYNGGSKQKLHGSHINAQSEGRLKVMHRTSLSEEEEHEASTTPT